MKFRPVTVKKKTPDGISRAILDLHSVPESQHRHPFLHQSFPMGDARARQVFDSWSPQGRLRSSVCYHSGNYPDSVHGYLHSQFHHNICLTKHAGIFHGHQQHK
jgi:hypothetical protein